MNKKIRKSLFILSENSRVSTRQLSKELKVSQQSASYLVGQLVKKKMITQYSLIVDPIKLGFINILVGLNYINFDKEIKKQVVSELKSKDYIISLYEADSGIDLLVEFSVANLSSFNKLHTEFIKKMHKHVNVKFIMPIVVKHIFSKNYLKDKLIHKDIVVGGDRETNILANNEKIILNELISYPNATYISMFKKTGITVRKIVTIKKKLERLKIIRGYSCVFNHNKLGISKRLILLKLSGKGISEVNSLVMYAKLNKNIVSLTKLLGDYNLLLFLEEVKCNTIVQEIRELFSVEDYLTINISTILKKRYSSLLSVD